ncbi:chemotaxis protein CheB [Thermodesulfobacteriota bacterium]
MPDKKNQSKLKPEKKGKGKERPDKPYPIVGIGSSAGGLEAIESFFRAMPDEIPEMTFVVVSHLDPKHSSILPSLIQKHTDLSVHQIEDNMKVQPHRVYVIPPDRDLEIKNGALHLLKIDSSLGLRAPINHFFCSLAEQQGEISVGIILSGMGSDGTIGIQAIKGELGMVMVQDPESAKYDAMPQSAISTGLVDVVLTTEEMPENLIEYVNRLVNGEGTAAENIPSGILKKIHSIIRLRTGHDFSNYKNSTVLRRIARRMNIHGISNPSAYANYLRKNEKENDALAKELLIGVTSFFRDGQAFEALKEKVLPKLFENKPAGYTLRGWIAGCATGEEAYSLAMIMMEYIEENQLDMSIQLFATDLDENAILKARAGLYFGDISNDIGSERLRMFFSKENNGYRVASRIREAIVFATQSVIKDPPFTKLDVISCRNLLIYLDRAIQKKLLPLFHHSLKPEGVLFLGSSETIGEYETLFSTLDNKWKIFQKKGGIQSVLHPLDFPMAAPKYEPKALFIEKEADIAGITERTLLDHYTPPSVVIDGKGDIRYIHGRITPYLQPPQGVVRNYNAIDMARKGFKLFLISTMRNITPDSEAVIKVIKVRKENRAADVRVTVSPMPKKEGEGLYIVLFEDIANKMQPNGKSEKKADDKADETSGLREELEATKERLRITMEELETSNEEMRSANEEYQSTNEELQSANEELNSSKEELQSLNEELETVNSELKAKVLQVETAYGEMHNMLNSLNIPMIFLDHDLCIRRFSSNADTIVELIESDVGRPLTQLASKVADVDLEKASRKVLETMEYVERQVKTGEGHHYLMRILPYLTVANQQVGAVLTFVDIQASEQLQKIGDARKFAEGIIETVREPLLVLDQELKVMFANESFYRTFHVSEKQVKGHSIFKLGDGQWDMPELRELLEDVLPNRQSFEDFKVDHKFPKIGRKKMLLNARRISEHGVSKDRILLAIEDVTERELKK